MRVSYIAAVAAAGSVLAVGGAVAVAQIGEDPPIEPAGVGSPAPVANPGTPQPAPASQAPQPGRGPRDDVAASMRTLRPHFGLLRRSRRAGDPGDNARLARAHSGRAHTVSVDRRGLCISGSGGSACGDPTEAAAGVAMVAHSDTPKGEALEGVVPDRVARVRITTTSRRTIDVPVADNVFDAWLPAPQRSSSISWVMRDGSVQRKIP